MPSKSAKQARMMAAAAHSAEFAKKVGVPQKVAKEFNQADKGTGIRKKKKKNESSSYFNGLIECGNWCGTGKDKLPGGVDASDLDKFLSKFDPEEVSKGIKVEMEHTKDRSLAAEIASDHLDEDPHYYTKLVAMEKKGKKESVTPYFDNLIEGADENLYHRLLGQHEGLSAWLDHEKSKIKAKPKAKPKPKAKKK